MTMTRERRPEFRSQESWAIGTLLAAGAIHECDDHGYMKDRADPHARNDAFQMARHQPFPGLSPDEAVKAVQDFLHTVGDTCPSCV